jgi:hypothetical protein
MQNEHYKKHKVYEGIVQLQKKRKNLKKKNIYKTHIYGVSVFKV